MTERDYRAWAKWQEAGRHPSMRPKRLPDAIPPATLKQWQARYRKEHPPKPKPRPRPFSGAGLFTGWDPGIILRRRPAVDWVAVTIDQFNGVPGCSAVMSAQLRAVGYKVYAWEARMTHGQAAVAELSAAAYIGQGESQPELEACLATKVSVPKGIVGNPVAWTVDGQARAEAAGWELLLECYWNEQPWLQPDSRGMPVASFTLGLYPVQGEQKTLADYREHWPFLGTAAWSGYLAEEMCEADWQLIGAK